MKNNTGQFLEVIKWIVMFVCTPLLYNEIFLPTKSKPVLVFELCKNEQRVKTARKARRVKVLMHYTSTQ